jgi:hypothetical protein
VAEIAADFMTTFYHVQVGALETQEFRTTPVLLIYALVDLNRRSTLFKRLPVKIGFVRANLISFNVNNGRSFK